MKNHLVLFCFILLVCLFIPCKKKDVSTKESEEKNPKNSVIDKGNPYAVSNIKSLKSNGSVIRLEESDT